MDKNKTMDHPKLFLLKKIAGYKENGLESLGELNAKHITDLSQVLLEFGQAMVREVIARVNKGEAVNIGNGIVELKRTTKSRQNLKNGMK